jgi:PKD repeat protein
MSASDGSLNAPVEGVEATIDTAGLSEGQHIVFVRGQDAAGNWGAFSAVFLYISASGPSVEVVNPAEGSTVVGTVTVRIDATDAEDPAGTLTVEWNVDGGAWQPATYNGGTGYYEAPWDTTMVADGSHTLNAQATDSDTNVGSDSNGVTVDNVNEPPVASFTYTCTGLSCDFDGSGSYAPDGAIVSYDWDFGDGSPHGNEATANHTYATAGTYSVVLTVTDDDGATDTDAQDVTVSQPPAASFTFTCTDLSCDFDGSGSYDPDGTIVSYDWDYGDGSPHGSGVTASHTYLTADTYTVILTVTDDDGATDTDTQDVTVSELLTVHVGDLDGVGTAAPRGRWDATVTITVHNGNEGAVSGALVEGTWSGGATGGVSCTTDASGQCSVTKGNLKSNVPDVTWSVSNVTSGVGAYVAGENHDPDGDSDGTTIVVSQPVENTPPVATFTYGCTDLTCDFDGSGSYDPDGSIVSYDWDFGDGNTGGGATASHTYDAEGSYTVVLTVTDDGGATDTDTQNVPVGNIPTIHVGDLDGVGAPVRSKWEATVTITVHGHGRSRVYHQRQRPV